MDDDAQTTAAPEPTPQDRLSQALAMADSMDWSDDAGAETSDTGAAGTGGGAGEDAVAEGGQATAEAAGGAEDPDPKGDGPPADSPEPDSDDLYAVAKRAQSRRLERSQAPADPPPQQTQQTPQVDDRWREMLEREHLLATDPLTYFERYKPAGQTIRQHYERLTKLATGGQQVKAEDLQQSVAQQMQELQQRYDAQIEQLRQEREEEKRAAAVERVFREYDAIASNAEHYPLLAALDDDERRRWGDRVAEQYNAAGEEWDLAKIARTAEATLRNWHRRWAGGGTGATDSTTKSAPVTGGRSADEAAGATSSTLTNAMASESAGPPEYRTEQERIREATRVLGGIDLYQ